MRGREHIFEGSSPVGTAEFFAIQIFDSFDWPTHSSWLAILIPIAVQFLIFLRWLHRRMRNDEITRAFVRDIATNHLPHIYNALQKIATQQGITLDETPLVQFVDLNHRK